MGNIATWNNHSTIKIGINNTPRTVSIMKVGVNNTPRNVHHVYVGVNNTSRLVACLSNCTCNTVWVCDCDGHCYNCSNCGDSCDRCDGCGGDCGGNNDSSPCCQGG